MRPPLLSRYRFARIAFLASIALASLSGRSATQQPPSGARATAQGILIDFQDADLRNVITALAEAAGLNVTFGELPQRRVTLRVRQPVPNDSVRALLRAVAEANGVRAIEEAGLLRFESVQQRTAEPQQTGATRQPSTPQLYVYRLRHARSATLAATLQAIFGGAVTTTETPESNMMPLSQRLREQQLPALRLDTLQRGRGQAVASTPLATGRLQSDVQIVPDENTNSLLVRASPADWEVVQQAIQAVDLRPLQVLIEVLIAEVRRSNELSVGVSAAVNQTSQPDRSATLTGGGDLSTGELLLKWLHSHGDVDVKVALSALATRGDVRILSRPVLLAQNNQEARILVGSQRPFVQVFRSLPTETGVRDQIVQYRDVGTSLTIVPTVNADGYVNLQLTQEVSSATNETQFGAPVISTREAQTFLFVRDGQTTVIGGLIDHQTERTRSGIPFLVSIPVLGALFGTTHNTATNSELFLFLTPHVVSTDADLEDLRESIERRLEYLPSELRKRQPFDPGARPQGAIKGAAPARTPADSSARKPEP